MKFIKNLEFIRSINKLASNPKETLYIIGLDLGFLLLAGFFGVVFESFVSNATTMQNSFPIVATQVVFYYILIILTYCLFQFSVVSYIKSLFKKSEFSFNGFKNFVLLNIYLVLITSIIWFLANLILNNAKEQYIFAMTFILLLPLFMFTFILLIASQVSYIKNFDIKKSILNGLNAIKEKRIYIGVVSPTLIILMLVSFIVAPYFTNPNIPINQVVQISTFLLSYILLLINRTSIYSIVNKTKYNVLS